MKTPQCSQPSTLKQPKKPLFPLWTKITMGIICLWVIIAIISRQKNETIEYTIIKEELYDVPIKTQITLNLLVPNDITELNLRLLLESLYINYKNKKGFKYHDSLTNFYVYAYTTMKKYEADWGEWVAMLEKGYDDTQSTIRINMLNK